MSLVGKGHYGISNSCLCPSILDMTAIEDIHGTNKSYNEDVHWLDKTLF